MPAVGQQRSQGGTNSTEERYCSSCRRAGAGVARGTDVHTRDEEGKEKAGRDEPVCSLCQHELTWRQERQPPRGSFIWAAYLGRHAGQGRLPRGLQAGTIWHTASPSILAFCGAAPPEWSEDCELHTAAPGSIQGGKQLNCRGGGKKVDYHFNPFTSLVLRPQPKDRHAPECQAAAPL